MIGWGLVEFALSGTLDGVEPCGCGLATCVEPWEPGCGLGTSAEHAVEAPPEDVLHCTCAAGGDCFICDETN